MSFFSNRNTRRRTGRSIAKRAFGSSLEKLEDRRLLCTEICINVLTGPDGESPTVEVSGEETNPITQNALSAFFKGVSLNDAIHTYNKQRYPHFATGNVFDRLKIYPKFSAATDLRQEGLPGCRMCRLYDDPLVTQVQTTVRPVEPVEQPLGPIDEDNTGVLEYHPPEVTDTSSDKPGLTHFIFKKNPQPATAKIEVKFEEGYSTSHVQSTSETVGMSASVSYGIGNFSGDLTYSTQKEWSKEEGEEKSFKVGSGGEFQFRVPPFEEIESFARYEKGSVTVRAAYEATISGHLVVEYSCISSGFLGTSCGPDGSIYEAIDVGEVLRAVDIERRAIQKSANEAACVIAQLVGRPCDLPDTESDSESDSVRYYEDITIPLYVKGEVVTRYLNDTFDKSRLIQPGDPIRVITDQSSREDGEPMHANVPTDASVWYKWSVKENGTAHIITKNDVEVDGIAPAWDTVLAVYTGDSVDNLSPVEGGHNNDVDPDVIKWSEVEFEVSAGDIIHISLSGHNGETGISDIVLSFTLQPPPNDDFAAATRLYVDQTAEQDTTGATRENLGEPVHVPDVTADTSVWYSWTAPSAGEAHLSTSGSNFDTVLAVYTGSTVNSLKRVDFNDDIQLGILQSELTFDADAGTTYRIAIAGKDNTTGNADVKVSFTPAPQLSPGDSNRDGLFNQFDIVTVLQGGKYLTGRPATFAEGDWNGDTRFDTLDIVLALQAGNYQPGGQASLSSLSKTDLQDAEVLAVDQLFGRP